MPRIAPRVLHHARKSHPLLPLVLQGTRDVASAKNELRWLEEYIAEQQQNQNQWQEAYASRKELRRLCVQRARGTPLQYLLGTEYFGDLEIACEPGVLIPRQETAVSVTHLIERLQSSQSLPTHLRVLDLCTGTGCIPLLFHYELLKNYGKRAGLEVVGVDISPRAMRLAQKNRERLLIDGSLQMRGSNPSLQFVQADVLSDEDHDTNGILPLKLALEHHDRACIEAQKHPKSRWDILISNPPYISPDAFNRTTTRSVRNFEPKLALVPETPKHKVRIDPGDVFYPRLLEIAKEVDAQVVLFEVADLNQASRVASMAHQQGIWSGIEIWRDDPAGPSEEDYIASGSITNNVKIVGSGNGRSVFAWRGDANAWLNKNVAS